VSEVRADELAWIERNDLLHQDENVAYVYRIRDLERTIIYVGCTRSEPAIRFSRHSQNASWWSRAATAEICEVTYPESLAVEAAQIHRWHPVGNRLCPVCKSLRARPDPVKAGSPRPGVGISINVEALQAARKRLALSAPELAQKIVSEYGDTLSIGMSRDFMHKIEQGKRRVRPATLRALAMALECEPASLIQAE
jgi:DNA-binding Xre family transcriptional regulator